MNRETLETDLRSCGLMLAGVCNDPALVPSDAQSIALISPLEPGFWPLFTASPEWNDGKSDPMDRWSKRVLTPIATAHDAAAFFPSDGPPYAPFYTWAISTGRVFESPIRFLVGDRAGLFVSFRAALALPYRLEGAPSQSPCLSCTAQPCKTACPVGALTVAGYDTEICHAFLDTAKGSDCLHNGCLVRRACPVVTSLRDPKQSAYHMSQFHP